MAYRARMIPKPIATQHDTFVDREYLKTELSLLRFRRFALEGPHQLVDVRVLSQLFSALFLGADVVAHPQVLEMRRSIGSTCVISCSASKSTCRFRWWR